MLFLVWLWACGGGSAPVKLVEEAPLSPEEEAKKAASEAKIAAAAAERAALPAAATRARYGLSVGVSEHAAVDSWLEQNKLKCQQFPSPTRETFQYRCDGLLPIALLADRSVRGMFTQLHLVRTEDAPIHFFSTMRKYLDATDAIYDYDDTVARLTATLGAARRADPVPGPEKLTGEGVRIARYAANWRFSDLDVNVVLLKASGNSVSLQESWMVPGVEEQVATHARTGSVSGAEGSRPPAWNPHVDEAPSVGPRRSAVAPPRAAGDPP